MKKHPASQQFVAAVNELMTKEGLSHEDAWAEAKRRNRLTLYRGIEAVNELPPGATLSQDGQRLVGDWPVSPAVLGALGLPLSATREQYQIFKTADAVKDVPPEMAAKIVMTLVRFQQLTQGMTFDDTLKALKQHFPEIFQALNQVTRATP